LDVLVLGLLRLGSILQEILQEKAFSGDSTTTSLFWEAASALYVINSLNSMENSGGLLQ
jgi:hypothetical protein